MSLAEDISGVSVELYASGVAVVTLNRPDRLNAMTAGFKRDLTELVVTLQFDDRVRVVVFTGAGRAFCAGDDISGKHPSPETPETVPAPPDGPRVPIRTYARLRHLSQNLNRAIRNLDKLTLAAINGDAIQSGLSLALACDFRIASTEARLGSATLRFGFLPDEGGHYLLVQHIGVAKTIDFLMNERIVDAEEALELGLVGEVVKPGALESRTLELAEDLCGRPQVAVRLLKRSVYGAAEQSFEQSLEDIAVKAAVSDYHEDGREGRPAFREKRSPRFNQWLEDDG